jgi:hypothetical protein
MMRAIGFLSGICLTIAALVLVLENRDGRLPEDVPPAPTAEQLSQVVAAIAEQVDPVLEANPTGEAIAPQPEPAAAGIKPQRAVNTNAPDALQQPEAQAAAKTAASQPHTAATGSEPQRAAATTATTAPASEQQTDAPPAVQTDSSGERDNAGSGTYTFWSPFRSVWAAQGFARRLTAATQVPVEVVNGGPGNYRVAFSYQDEQQRRTRMDRITTITGLTLE